MNIWILLEVQIGGLSSSAFVFQFCNLVTMLNIPTQIPQSFNWHLIKIVPIQKWNQHPQKCDHKSWIMSELKNSTQ
jgi:hypothetical protein